MSDFDLRGKVVCITGGSSGIGRASALEFARAGARVAVAARSGDLLDEVVREIQALGGEALAVTTDVRSEDQVKALVRRVEEGLSPIDVMVLNAGLNIKKEAAGYSLDDWRFHFDVNFWGVIHGIYAVLPGMTERGGGQIVIVNSLLGKLALPMVAPYSSSKFALTALADSIRPEFKRRGIDVIAIYPSFVPTNISNLDNLSRGARLLSPFVPLDKAARIIVDACRKRKREVDFSLTGKAVVRLAPFARGLTARIVDRLYDRIEKNAKSITKADWRERTQDRLDGKKEDRK